ncbi:MAG: AbiEi antitoxin N-terminal domain-containing protein [Chromatiaceae bacterium]|nr:AbiEi antitoxin N-terminal domain-containing protein [Chromatiaceae bacterium]MBP6806863.1 AbiEi antitoxin N-terminal domain-containing protein [Chromatiaceae bacterium]
METTQQSILDLARTCGLLRPLDLTAHGLPRVSLTRLVRQGRLARVGRGLYALPDREVSEYAALAEVARMYPRAVVCLLSALRFHDITTQAPFEVWLAIPNKARPPRLDSLHLSGPLRIVRFSEAGLTEGVEEHLIDAVPVRITGVARTVADCFKYRNKIGLDVALEALKDVLGRDGQGRRAGIDEIWRYAQLGRVANVMRPYLESLA